MAFCLKGWVTWACFHKRKGATPFEQEKRKSQLITRILNSREKIYVQLGFNNNLILLVYRFYWPPMTFEPAFRMAERELLSSLIDSENEFDAVQRRLLELSELFPLTFWKHLDRLNVQEQRTPRWSFLINTNGIQESVTHKSFFQDGLCQSRCPDNRLQNG